MILTRLPDSHATPAPSSVRLSPSLLPFFSLHNRSHPHSLEYRPPLHLRPPRPPKGHTRQRPCTSAQGVGGGCHFFVWVQGRGDERGHVRGGRGGGGGESCRCSCSFFSFLPFRFGVVVLWTLLTPRTDRHSSRQSRRTRSSPIASFCITFGECFPLAP
jgi:hypothetical protein